MLTGVTNDLLHRLHADEQGGGEIGVEAVVLAGGAVPGIHEDVGGVELVDRACPRGSRQSSAHLATATARSHFRPHGPRHDPVTGIRTLTWPSATRGGYELPRSTGVQPEDGPRNTQRPRVVPAGMTVSGDMTLHRLGLGLGLVRQSQELHWRAGLADRHARTHPANAWNPRPSPADQAFDRHPTRAKVALELTDIDHTDGPELALKLA